MNKLLKWLSKHRPSLKISKALANTHIPFFVRKVYSAYRTSEGIMFYVNTKRGDVFIHVFNRGGYEVANGWDGGNLRALPVVRKYYAAKGVSLDYQEG
jgi:hypothetical protein